jgi:hypothetical protein
LGVLALFGAEAAMEFVQGLFGVLTPTVPVPQSRQKNEVYLSLFLT